MQIDNLIINAELMDVLTELRNQLNANGLHYFEKMFDSGEDIMVCCPYHKDGREKKPSAGIRKSDGMFHCLACGETHSLPEVISYCLGASDPLSSAGYKWLISRFVSVEVQKRDTIELNLSREQPRVVSPIVNKVSDEELDTYRYTHPYMYERGLNDSIIDLFDIGYDRYTDSITFPVKNSTGDCIFVARRNVRSKRFDIPKGIEKPLYGLYEAQSAELSDVYVCEGLFDCLRLWCNGRIAVAGFGCLFSEYQIKQLQDLPTRHLILALDNDEAGREATKKLRKAINDKLITEVVIPNGKKDIGELTDDEIQNLQEVF